MPYVQRNSDGKVIATFGQMQIGFAEELLTDDDPEVIAARQAFRNMVANDDIRRQLAANDANIVRAVIDGDTARIAAHKQAQAALRAKLT